MKTENVAAVAIVAGAGLYLLVRRRAAAAAAPVGVQSPYFTSPAVASGVQAGQNIASSLGSLVRGGMQLLQGVRPSATPINTNQATTPSTGDFARLDRLPPTDGLAFNPPNNEDPWAASSTQDQGGMPQDLADFWG